MMTSKQRVHAALRREPVDRIPIYMWLHPDTAQRLAALLEVPAAAVGPVLGDDIRQTWVNNNYAMEGIVHENDGEGHVDAWGIEWVKDGPFNQIARSPLHDLPPEQVRAYRFPEDRVDALLDRMVPVAAQGDTYFIGCDVSPCVFEMYWRLRGMQQALMDLFLEPELARAMLSACAEFSVLLARKACERFDLGWLWAGDDAGGQSSTIISPEAFREQVKPNLAKVFAVAREHGLWMAFHSCGAIRPLIPDLIEIGLDVLNPIQCNAEGMDPFELKREFGRDLAFMGGVDTQDLLPFGTPAEVRRSTERLIEGMTADGGGYILAASHAIPPETPDENIFALYESAGVTKEEIFDRAAAVRAGRVPV